MEYKIKLVEVVHNFLNDSGILTSRKPFILRSISVKEASVSNNNDREELLAEDREVVEVKEEERLINLLFLSRVSDTMEKIFGSNGEELVQEKPTENVY